jgi:hypothetical protein
MPQDPIELELFLLYHLQSRERWALFSKKKLFLSKGITLISLQLGVTAPFRRHLFGLLGQCKSFLSENMRIDRSLHRAKKRL